MTIEEISSTLNKALDHAGYKAVRVTLETSQGSGRDVTVEQDGPSVLVHIFPVIIKKTSFEAVKCVLAELGDFLLGANQQPVKDRWEKRFVNARLDQVNLFQGKLASGNYPTFEAIVRSIERAADRLVAIHLANGLLSNGQTATTARNIHVAEWGTTSEFANGTKPYSLIPLLSVYAPAGVYQHYGEAFADSVLSKLGSVAESSVKQAYLELVQLVAQILRK